MHPRYCYIKRKCLQTVIFETSCPILSFLMCPQVLTMFSGNDCRKTFHFSYEEHNELVEKTIPKENLLIWNLKDGWEPLCTFLDVPMPDVPIPRENTTGDFKWAEEYFHQDKVTRNGIKYFVGYCILIIVILFCVIFFPIKYA